MRPRTVQVSMRVALRMASIDPFADRMPPQTFRAITSGRRERSASLLVGGTSGLTTKVKRSWRGLRMRSQCVRWGASESMNGWQSRVVLCSNLLRLARRSADLDAAPSVPMSGPGDIGLPIHGRRVADVPNNVVALPGSGCIRYRSRLRGFRRSYFLALSRFGRC